MKNLPETCACGKKQHIKPSQLFLLKHLGYMWGDYKEVQIMGGKKYKVPTYYIIVHGLKAKDLPNLGFEILPS